MGFVATIPFWVLCIIVGLYFFKRKPNNNLRYSSPRYMPEKRKQYIAKLKKYVGVVSVSIGILFCLTFSSFLLLELLDTPHSFYENLFLYTQQHPFIIYPTVAGFLGWCLALYFYDSRNIKYLQKLLEEMSDADYERFTQMMQLMNFAQRYSPFVVICQGKAYFMSNLSEGIPLTDIVHLEWKCRQEHHSRSKKGNRLIEEAYIYTRQQPNTPITVTMPKEQYRFLERAYRQVNC